MLKSIFLTFSSHTFTDTLPRSSMLWICYLVFQNIVFAYTVKKYLEILILIIYCSHFLIYAITPYPTHLHYKVVNYSRKNIWKQSISYVLFCFLIQNYLLKSLTEKNQNSKTFSLHRWNFFFQLVDWEEEDPLENQKRGKAWS